MSLQITDEIGSSTLIGCGFHVEKGESASSEQGVQTPLRPVPSDISNSSTPSLNTLMKDHLSLKGEIADMKKALVEEKELNAKCCEDLLNAISTFVAKFSSPSFSSI